MKNLFKTYWYFILIILLLIPMYFIFTSEENSEMSEVVEEQVELKEDIKDSVKYYVDIKGEVKNPGVYEVEINERIKDVIKKAGGLTKNADISLINLSKKVTDEMSIKIYSKSEVNSALDYVKSKYKPQVIEVIKEVEKEVEKECKCEICNNTDLFVEEKENNQKEEKLETINNNKININTATKEELMTVKGVGESKAIKIIEYREKTKFNSIEDIKEVPGIGDAMFEKIKEFITV